MLRQIDARTWVSGQIEAEDVARLKAAGVTMIVNNRPDGEEPGQPPGAEIEAAAREAGLSYRHIPMAPGGLSSELVQQMAEAMEESDGIVLAFCRSGTRSTYLWALACSQQGAAGEDLVRKAAAAGYDLTPLTRFLR